MATTALDQMLTQKQAAEVLGVKEQTLAAWRSTKRYALPYHKVGRCVRYRLSDLERFLDERQVGADE